MILSSGAEAIITRKDDTIIKTRVAKTYRHPQLDTTLRKSRTKAEAMILQKLQDIAVPHYHHHTTDSITMQYIQGPKVRDILTPTTCTAIATQIAHVLSTIHERNIIHNDVTTSNMIYKNNTVYLIDFGLSVVSTKIEDKAVDLKLLFQALDAYHVNVAQDMKTCILQHYTHTAVKERLTIVQKRGKYKQKY
ncbi:MAG: KEOPS complex kinase/ATPase Bud32 [Candidatus Woesearchaeota archaeon]